MRRNYERAECGMHRYAHECEQERKAMQVCARSGKPAGYTWRLWHDEHPRLPKRKPTGSLHVPAWAHEAPAYKRILAAENTNEAAERRARLYCEWLAKREAA